MNQVIGSVHLVRDRVTGRDGKQYPAGRAAAPGPDARTRGETLQAWPEEAQKDIALQVGYAQSLVSKVAEKVPNITGEIRDDPSPPGR